MFKLLSKESNIFSVPVYLGFLLFIIISFNIFNFSGLNTVSAIITFIGVAIGYFLFNNINLTYQTHLPLFLYTFFVFAFYPGYLDIGIAVSLLTNSFILLVLTDQDDSSKNGNYVLVGSLLALNFIFLPVSFPFAIFVILHIFSTADRLGLNIFRLFFGMLLMFFAYFCLAYFLDWNSWNPAYFPKVTLQPLKDFYPLYFLVPVALMMIYAVFDHFRHYNQKSPTSRYKYTFVLIYTIAQLVTIILYMGSNLEFLILLAFPASIILSRLFRFFPKYWMSELSLWICLISLVLFKAARYVDFF